MYGQMDLLTSANKALRHVLIARGVRSSVELLNGHPVHTYFVRGEGRGPPVVLLHGLGGSANGFYKTFFLLSKKFSAVWAPDLPGNGFSPLPSGGALKLEAQVRLLVACLAVIFGYYGAGRGQVSSGALEDLVHYVDTAIVALGQRYGGSHPLAQALQGFVADIENLREGEALDLRPADYL